MKLGITERAKVKLKEAIMDSQFNEPVLKIIFQGFG
jgi:hypothetical protein